MKLSCEIVFRCSLSEEKQGIMKPVTLHQLVVITNHEFSEFQARISDLYNFLPIKVYIYFLIIL